MITVIQGDCRTVLRTLDAGSVQCCVTSPPYWGLRDYGNTEQIGLEPTPDAYVREMVQVFREVWRVLKDDGTLWLNLGDSYNSGPSGGLGGSTLGGGQDNQSQSNRAWRNGAGRADGVVDERAQRNRNGVKASGLKPKDLIGIPWRVAFALQSDGWWLRQDIIWHKPNPMPESVTDRCTKAHEYLFLLSKSAHYYYDAEAIKEPCAVDDERGPRTFGNGGESRGMHRDNGRLYIPKSHRGSTFTKGKTAAAHPNVGQGERQESFGRNKRSVWTVPTSPYAEAHFATFPPGLIKPCILAGSKAGDTVLDPFGGSGTTGMVALEYGRKAVLIELNHDYVALCHERCAVTPGLAL